VIVWIVVGVLVASLMIASAGRSLRFGFWGYFFASLLLTPVMGLLLLLAAIPSAAQRRAMKQAAVRR
jgi:hypothetical protein